MNGSRAWLTYAGLRLLFFAVPLGVLFWLGSIAGLSVWASVWMSALGAGGISFALSLLLLNGVRERAAAATFERRAKRAERAGRELSDDRGDDERAEDALLEPDREA